MKFDTYIPCDPLKPYVKSIVIQETDDASTYKVLPDTGVVIGFQYKGLLSLIDQGKELQLAISGISGLADHYKTFRNSPGIGTVLVFFNEGGASVFFRQPVHELFRESISLDNFLLRSELLMLEEQLHEAGTDQTRIDVVEKFLISRMRTMTQDKLVLQALALIHQSHGTVRISDLAQQLNISQSPLEKRFRSVIGASPKKFASIIRLRYAIQQYQDADSLTALGYQAGFYDQAHFIREFKHFTGETPESFFKDRE